MSYDQTTIGNRSVMIPDAALMHLRDRSGRENLNRIEFTHCQAFHSDSTLRLEPSSVADLPPQTPPLARAASTMTLPAGLQIAIDLMTPVSDQTTVGSLIEGAVAEDVRTSGGILLAAGPKVKGRVRRLERYSSKEGAYFVVAFEFTDFDSGRFFADFETVDRA